MSKIIIAKKGNITIIDEAKTILCWFYIIKYKLKGYEVETLRREDL